MFEMVGVCVCCASCRTAKVIRREIGASRHIIRVETVEEEKEAILIRTPKGDQEQNMYTRRKQQQHMVCWANFNKTSDNREEYKRRTRLLYA